MLEVTRDSVSVAIQVHPKAQLVGLCGRVGEERRVDREHRIAAAALRVARWLPWILLTVGFVACLAMSVSVVANRVVAPGEAEILHEASRIRHGLRLFVDAVDGQHEYAGPPSRGWVLYPPFTSWLVSHFPDQSALVLGRLVSLIAFVVALAWPVVAAPRRNRQAAGLAALFVGSIFVLWLFTSIIRPDPIAILLSCVLLERVARLGRADVLVGVLASVVVLVKPNMCGAPIGVLLGSLLWSRAEDRSIARRAVLAAAVTLFIGLTVLAVWSDGAFVEHFLRSFGHPWALAKLTSHILPRLTTVVGPFALAVWLLLSRRGEASSRIMMTALVTSLAVMCVTLSRFGSASNYWLEPLFIALVIVSKHARWPVGRRLSVQWTAAVLLTIQAAIPAYLAVDGVDDLRESVEADRRLLQRAKDRCAGIVRADQPGIEYELNGRVVAANFTLNHAIETGHFSSNRFLEELFNPTTSCVITTNTGGDPFGGFIPSARPLLAQQFELDSAMRNGSLYVRRNMDASHAEEGTSGAEARVSR